MPRLSDRAAVLVGFLSVRAPRHRNKLETAYSLRPSDQDSFDIGGRRRTGHQHRVSRGHKPRVFVGMMQRNVGILKMTTRPHWAALSTLQQALTVAGYACALLCRRRPRMPNPTSAVPNSNAAGGSGTVEIGGPSKTTPVAAHPVSDTTHISAAKKSLRA
jgi:hypothetical protein